MKFSHYVFDNMPAQPTEEWSLFADGIVEEAKKLEADAERYETACDLLGGDIEEAKEILSKIASPAECEDAADHASKCLQAFNELKKDAALGHKLMAAIKMSISPGDMVDKLKAAIVKVTE